MARHRLLFTKLSKNAVIVMDRTLEAGGIVVIEWPASCTYWRLRAVKAFIKRYNVQFVRIDGCAFGMRSSTGALVLKPWALCTSSAAIVQKLQSYRWSRDHTHEHLQGRETGLSAHYPTRMAQAVHKIFSHIIADMRDTENGGASSSSPSSSLQ